MRVRSWVLLGLLLGMGSVGQAQVGVYGKFDFIHSSSSTSGSSSHSLAGGGVGIYDDFAGLGPVRLGLDLRGDFVGGDNLRFRSILGGVRVAVRVPLVGVRPYVQGSIGVGGTRSNGPFAAGISNVPYSNRITYEGLAGVDLRVLPHIDFRAVELGIGAQSQSGGGTATLFSASTGVVVRF